jgi:hypothetical protein
MLCRRSACWEGEAQELSLVSERRIQQTLRLMGQSPDKTITPEIARDLCQRVGSVAALASAEATADGKEHVLKALSQAAGRMREKLGESIATAEKFDTPLDQVTTPSLDALQAFSRGRVSMMGKGDFTAPIPQLEKAVRRSKFCHRLRGPRDLFLRPRRIRQSHGFEIAIESAVSQARTGHDLIERDTLKTMAIE